MNVAKVIKKRKTSQWGGGGRQAGMKTVHGEKLKRQRLGLVPSLTNFLEGAAHPLAVRERKGESAAFRFALRWYIENRDAITLPDDVVAAGRPQGEGDDAETVTFRSYHLTESQIAFMDAQRKAMEGRVSRSSYARRLAVAWKTAYEESKMCKHCTKRWQVCPCGALPKAA